MRRNLPVAQHEYPVPSDETLLATTDISVRIPCANAAFMRTQGAMR